MKPITYGVVTTILLLSIATLPLSFGEEYTVTVDNTNGFSVSSLTIQTGDTVTFTTSIQAPYSVAITDILWQQTTGMEGHHAFDNDNPISWTYQNEGTWQLTDQYNQFSPMTLIVSNAPVSTPTPIETITSADYTITIIGTEGCEVTWGCYNPYVQRVPVGSTVEFYNPTDSLYRVNGAASDDGEFILEIHPGETMSIPFALNTEQIINYTDDLYPWMYGEIVVGESDYVSPDVLSEILNDVPEPTGSDLLDLQDELQHKDNQILVLSNQLADVTDTSTTLVEQNAQLQITVSALQAEVAESANNASSEEVEALQEEVKKWRLAAEKWQNVAMRQLEIMVNALGL